MSERLWTPRAHSRYMDQLGAALVGNERHRHYREAHPLRYRLFILLAFLHCPHWLSSRVIKSYPEA